MGKGNKDLCDSSSFPGSTYEDNWTAENAKTLLRRRPTNKPFFIQVNFPGPHPPFLVTADMLDVEAGNTFTGGIDGTASNTSFKCISTGEPDNDPEKMASGRCDYAAEIENIDARMADIIDLVKSQGVIDNTLIVFASDHGTMLGDHNDAGKTMPWQGSANVPLVVNGPGISKGVVRTNPVSIMDLAATFMDYGGATAATGMTSISMRSLFEGRSITSARPFVASGLQSMQFNSSTGISVQDNENLGAGGGYNWRMVVKYYNESVILKFICCIGECNGAPSNVLPPQNGFTQLLYNIVDDPFDMRPLQATPEYAATVSELRELLPTVHWTCGKNT